MKRLSELQYFSRMGVENAEEPADVTAGDMYDPYEDEFQEPADVTPGDYTEEEFWGEEVFDEPADVTAGDMGFYESKGTPEEEHAAAMQRMINWTIKLIKSEDLRNEKDVAEHVEFRYPDTSESERAEIVTKAFDIVERGNNTFYEKRKTALRKRFLEQEESERLYQVWIPHNYNTSGSRYDYSARRLKTPVLARSEADAESIVLEHRDEIEEMLRGIRMHNGKRLIMKSDTFRFDKVGRIDLMKPDTIRWNDPSNVRILTRDGFQTVDIREYLPESRMNEETIDPHELTDPDSEYSITDDEGNIPDDLSSVGNIRNPNNIANEYEDFFGKEGGADMLKWHNSLKQRMHRHLFDTHEWDADDDQSDWDDQIEYFYGDLHDRYGEEDEWDDDVAREVATTHMYGHPRWDEKATDRDKLLLKEALLSYELHTKLEEFGPLAGPQRGAAPRDIDEDDPIDWPVEMTDEKMSGISDDEWDDDLDDLDEAIDRAIRTARYNEGFFKDATLKASAAVLRKTLPIQVPGIDMQDVDEVTEAMRANADPSTPEDKLRKMAYYVVHGERMPESIGDVSDDELFDMMEELIDEGYDLETACEVMAANYTDYDSDELYQMFTNDHFEERRIQEKEDSRGVPHDLRNEMAELVGDLQDDPENKELLDHIIIRVIEDVAEGGQYEISNDELIDIADYIEFVLTTGIKRGESSGKLINKILSYTDIPEGELEEVMEEAIAFMIGRRMKEANTRVSRAREYLKQVDDPTAIDYDDYLAWLEDNEASDEAIGKTYFNTTKKRHIGGKEPNPRGRPKKYDPGTGKETPKERKARKASESKFTEDDRKTVEDILRGTGLQFADIMGQDDVNLRTGRGRDGEEISVIEAVLETGDRGSRMDHGGPSGDGWMGSEEIDREFSPYGKKWKPKAEKIEQKLKDAGYPNAEVRVDYGEKGHISLEVHIPSKPTR